MSEFVKDGLDEIAFVKQLCAARVLIVLRSNS